ncbi:MAG: alginate O-acetyltransferase [Gammaproteobacteria bacterium]|nr:alginate O-acetyltransferase [Gammaproteobacteria bacterium]
MSKNHPSSGPELHSASRSYAPVGVVFALTVGVLSALSLPSLLSYRAPPVKVINGDLVRNFEEHFDKEFPLRTASINFWTALQLVLFHEGKTGVLLGTDGWLYTNEEFHVLPRWEQIFDQNLELIRWTQATLADAKVPLVVVVVPEKAHVYPEYINGHRQASAHATVMARLRAAIGEQTTLITLDDTFAAAKVQQPLFFHTDTHWTPAGAKLAAQAVTRAMAAKGLATKTGDADAFETTEQPEATLVGDLLSFLPLEPMFPSLMPKADIYVPVVTKAIEKEASAESLLSDESIPEVAVVGTSYTANDRWNFQGFLSEFLNEPLADYSKEGIGPFPPMAQFLTSQDYAGHKPRVVIWEIPERSLLGKAALKGIDLPEALTTKLASIHPR